jgi:hypothetical protein
LGSSYRSISIYRQNRYKPIGRYIPIMAVYTDVAGIYCPKSVYTARAVYTDFGGSYRLGGIYLQHQYIPPERYILILGSMYRFEWFVPPQIGIYCHERYILIWGGLYRSGAVYISNISIYRPNRHIPLGRFIPIWAVYTDLGWFISPTLRYTAGYVYTDVGRFIPIQRFILPKSVIYWPATYTDFGGSYRSSGIYWPKPG